MSIQILYLFIIQSWLVGRLCDSRNLSVLSRLSNLLANNYSQYSPIILFIPIKLGVMSPLSFLFLVI